MRRAGKREQDDERAKEHWVEKDDAAKGCCGGVGDSDSDLIVIDVSSGFVFVVVVVVVCYGLQLPA